MIKDAVLQVKIKVKFSMWQALKLRVSGICKNADLIKQVMEEIKISDAK